MKTDKNFLYQPFLKNLINAPLLSRSVKLRLYIGRKTYFSKKNLQKGAIKITKRLLVTYLISFIVLSGTGLVYLFNPWSVKETEAAWFNDNWGYRKEIPVTSTNGSAQTNKYITFNMDTAALITAGQLQSSCQDIRITDVNGNILDRYIGRSTACNNSATVVDFLVPSIPDGGSTYFVYYGNPTAPSDDVGNLSWTAASNIGAITLGSEVKAPSPSLYWKFDDGDGTTAQDSSINNRDGIISSGTWKSEDLCVSGKCLYFDGTAASTTAGAGGSADVTIDNDITVGTGDSAYLGSHKMGIAWASNLIGYSVYLAADANNSFGDLSYKKTTDGGQTWGTKVAVAADVNRVSIWYDKETSGDTGTKIHILYVDFPNDDLLYRTLDTATDTLSSAITIDAAFTSVGISSTYFVGGFVSITKARGGNLYAFAANGDSGAGGGGQANFYRSTDGGATWTSRTSPWQAGTDEFDDTIQIMPAGDTDANDIACIFNDDSADTLKFKLYDDSGNSWGSTTNIDTGMQAGDWPDAFWGFDVAIRHSDNKAIVAYWNGENSATSDLKVAELTLTAAGAAASAKTDVLTNTDTAGEAQVFIDNNSNDIYVSYLRGGTWDSLVDVYYKKSTDGGSNWSTQTKINNTQDDYRIMSTVSGIQSGSSGRFMPIWPDEDDSDLITNYSSSVSITSGSSVNLASTVSGVKSVAFWVKPSSFTTTTPLVDLNGTAKITTNSSGVITASGFTTVYVNGQVGTTISANTWNYVVATHGSDISASALKVGTDGTNNLVGFADEVKLYDSELSAAQVKANYIARGNPEGTSAVLGANTQNMPGALSNGLVGYWKLDESSGNATDSSGNSTTLTDGSSTTYAAGKFGNGADLESSSTDYLYAADNAALSLTGSVTLAAWIKPETVSAGTYNILGKWDGANESYRLMQNADEIRMEIDSNGNYQETSSSNLAAGTWYHVVGVYNSANATVKIYINGSEATSSTTGTIPSSIGDDGGRFQIGAEDSTGGVTNHYDGIVDGARIYNRSLSGAEVSQLYNWAPGPIGYWSLEEGSGTIAKDSSGNGNELTLNSSSWSNGKYGKGWNGDETKWMSRADDSDFDFVAGESFTVCLWQKADDGSAPAVLDLIDKADSSAGWGINIEGSGAARFWIDDDASFTPDDSATGTTDIHAGNNQWYYVCGVKTGNTKLELFVNGTLEGSDTSISATATLANSDSLTVGSNSTSGGGAIDGDLDDVKIYRYARTRAQIIEDMNAGHPAPGSPVGTPYGYWKFEEGDDNRCAGGSNDACNSGNGGNARDGAAGGSTVPSYVDGKFGRALSFGGSGGYIDIAAFNATTGASQISWSMWVKPNSLGTNECIFCMINNMVSGVSRAGTWAIIEGSSDSSKVKVIIPNSADKTSVAEYGETPTGTLVSGTWTHIGVVYDGTQTGNANRLVIYINGIKQTLTFNGTIPATTQGADASITANIGSDSANNASFYSGVIDELKLYTSALTADQMKLDMNRGQSQVLGTLSSSQANPQSAGAEYCVPGDSSTCTAPIARYDFEEGTGTTTYDTSGSNNTGSINAGFGSFTRGKVGKSYYFDGILGASGSTFINGASATGLDNIATTASQDLSVEAWIYPLSEGEGGNSVIIGKATGTTPTQGWIFQFKPSATNALRFIADTTTGAGTDISMSTADNAVTLNTWNHVAATWTGDTTDSSTIKIYVNGRDVSSSGSAAGTNSYQSDAAANLLLGNDSGSAATFDGLIDNVRVFNYVRTPAQIAWSMNRGVPIAHWKMDECQGTTLNDSAGNSLSGTLTLGAGGTTSAGTCTTSGSWFNGASGKRNYSMDFDGIDDYVTVADNDKLDISGSFTLSTWINPDSLPASSTLGWLIGKTGDPDSEAAGTDANYELMLDQGIFGSGQGISVAFEDSSHNDYVGTYRTTLTTGQWYLLTGVFDDSANTLTLYINGQPVTTTQTVNTVPGSITGSPATNANALQLAESNNAGPYSAEDRIDGKLDDARVYNYPLTAAQVKTLFNEGAARFGPSSAAP